MSGNVDKELIAMCDCPEIQDRWDAYLGQRFVIKGWDYIFYSIEIDREAEDTLISNGQGITRWFHKPDDYITYIPRIEDVLEWLKGKIENIEVTMVNYWEVKTITQQHFLAHPVKSLLKAYMHLEHNKTWNGEAWA